MTHTFLVTVEVEEDEDLDVVAEAIAAELTPEFGSATTVVPWSPHDDETL